MAVRDNIIWFLDELTDFQERAMRERRPKKWRPGVAAHLGAEYAHYKRTEPDDYRDAMEEASQTVCRVFTESASITHIQLEEAKEIIAGWGKAGLTVDSFKELPPGGVVKKVGGS